MFNKRNFEKNEVSFFDLRINAKNSRVTNQLLKIPGVMTYLMFLIETISIIKLGKFTKLKINSVKINSLQRHFKPRTTNYIKNLQNLNLNKL